MPTPPAMTTQLVLPSPTIMIPSDAMFTKTPVPDMASQETVSSTTTMLLPADQLTPLIDNLQADDVDVTEENRQLIVTLTLPMDDTTPW